MYHSNIDSWFIHVSFLIMLFQFDLFFAYMKWLTNLHRITEEATFSANLNFPLSIITVSLTDFQDEWSAVASLTVSWLLVDAQVYFTGEQIRSSR